MKWPGPNYNQLIMNDPQIVKVNLDIVEWGARRSLQNRLGGDAASPGQVAAPPSAPEMVLKHVGK